MLAEERRRASGSTPASPNANGIPTWRTAPQAGCSTSTVIPRAAACGAANAATMSLIGPHGISAASSAASQSAVGPRQQARGQDRAQLGPVVDPVAVVAKRGSSASAGTPSASQKPRPLALGADRDGEPPSAVANVSYGTMFGWALPGGPGAAAGDERVLRLVDEDREGRFEQRDVDPLARPGAVGDPAALPRQQRGQDGDRPEQPGHDVADRDADLGRLAAVASAAPVIDISPPAAWMTKS